MTPILTFADKVNLYLTPIRRQAIYQVIGIIGVLLTATSPAMSTQVAQWTQIIFALGTIGSLALGAIVTKAAQWPKIYVGIAALVAAITGASLITDGAANTVLRFVQAAITVAPLIVILARTDVSTPTGAPAYEVPAVVVPAVPVVSPAVPTASTKAGNNQIVYDPATPGQATVTTPLI